MLVKVCEGQREIKVSKPEPKSKSKPQVNGKAGSEDDGDEDDDEDEEEEEEEEIRETIWKVGTVLAEAAIRATKKGAKVEVTVNVGADLGVTITAREVGGKGGVRGQLLEKGGGGRENGSA